MTRRIRGVLRRRWRLLADRGAEHGGGGGMSIVLLLAGFAFLICTGLVVDGGAKAAALERASRVASEAARSGLQVANLSAETLPEVAAAAEVDRYLTAAGVTGTTTVDGTTVTVTVTITGKTRLLSLMGVTEWMVTGTGTADGLFAPSGER